MMQIDASADCTGDHNNEDKVTVYSSTDEGITWHVLFHYKDELQYVNDETGTASWKRITVALNQASSTRIRVSHSGNTTQQRLAIAYFYMGPLCPQMCRSNGRCTPSGCVCDAGFHGQSCTPERKIATSLPSTRLRAGRLATDSDPCFIQGAATNWHFDLAGWRFLETDEVLFTPGQALQFIIRLGYCDWDGTSEDVHIIVQLSWDGGLHWAPLREYKTPFFATAELSTVTVVPPADQSCNDRTCFFKARLLQVADQRAHENVWAVSALEVVRPSTVLTGEKIAALERPLETNEHFWIVRSVHGDRRACSVYDASSCSGNSYIALTKQMVLNDGDVIQFRLVAAEAAPVQTKTKIFVEYSDDGGLTWQLVQKQCADRWLNCRQLRQPSVIYGSALADDGQQFAYVIDENMAKR